MKKSILTFCATTVLALSISTASFAQVKLPQASSSTSITQGLGIKNIALTYQRPNVNGRVIFGDLVPYNEVWRTGANSLPVIKFEEEVTIEGNKVPAGTYGILTIPTKTDWTIILTKNSNQWGAYTYDKKDDLLRFNVKSEKLANKVESFTMQFENVTTNSATLSLAWANTLTKFNIKVDQNNEIMASIDEAMKGEKKPYLQAAQFYLNNNLDLNKALSWANEAEKANPNVPYISYWKAKIQLKAGDKKGAIATAQKGVELAQKENNAEYVKLNTQVIKQASK
ncbi:DUF2911 domain-containing protein [Sphingobacterium sp. SRCM116780]|uniref:DUF2911 domain-containing protein n=1 Tax=Sphingobacterium sp. SRCM116780 TaxID=2907623 RepID=UPI001F396253|nr:DUF2911 domain-containing protein [Sphingobacterium sp. SRCM116780]UIR56108.1 DUF2911 domain-containing protein [Sphingobacterium sp. SRCM116780]